MKISIMLLTTDERYYKKINEHLYKRFSDKFSLIYTVYERLDETFAKFNPDVLLIDEQYEREKLNLTKNVSIAYITNKPRNDLINDKPCFCKYISISELNKNIMNLVSDSHYAVEDGISGTFYLFSSAAGGNGATTCAYAYALSRAVTGKRVLLLSFDRFFDMKTIFLNNSPESMTNFLYTLHQGKNAIAKAETLICEDEQSKILYVNSVNESVELDEFTEDFAGTTFDSFVSASKADIVIVDVPYMERVIWKAAAKRASSIIIVNETTKEAVSKLGRFIKSVQLEEKIEQNSDTRYSITSKLAILKNKNKSTDNSAEIFGIKVAGTISKFSGDNFINIAKHISESELNF